MLETAKQVIKSLIAEDLAKVSNFTLVVKRACSSFGSRPLPHTILLEAYRNLVETGEIEVNEELEKKLKVRQVRTSSGVTPITVLTKPYYCPGKCVYCPLERGMPKSYLSNEPAAQRAKANHFDPYTQVANRIKTLEANGHEVDKLEVIVLGGSWSAYPRDYQVEFIKGCFDAANQTISPDLATAQKVNETARYRLIGLTLETRPDLIFEDEVKHLRMLGCTRVQLGAQHIDDDILKLIERGHTSEQLAGATKLLKQAGFKVDYHLMPDLPGTTPDKDVQMVKEVFSNPKYQPDQVKIYPTVVNEHAPLYKWWQEGKYKPMSSLDLKNVLLEISKSIPRYVRINRLIRDIPAESIVAGNSVTNLRQDIEEELKKLGTPCVCMRCRESREELTDLSQAKLFVQEYQASSGTECFLSYESPDQKKLYAFLRLRFNDQSPKFLPELEGCALVRELHTYGVLARVKDASAGKVQHLGFGQALMKEAENMAKAKGFSKMAVISGIGVRQYYQDKLGYKLQGTYMVKAL